MVDENTRRRILSRFASSLKLPATSDEDEIKKRIKQLPENGMIHPRDMLEELDKLLTGEISLPSGAPACT